jgi:hypothetical protein
LSKSASYTAQNYITYLIQWEKFREIRFLREDKNYMWVGFHKKTAIQGNLGELVKKIGFIDFWELLGFNGGIRIIFKDSGFTLTQLKSLFKQKADSEQSTQRTLLNKRGPIDFGKLLKNHHS